MLIGILELGSSITDMYKKYKSTLNAISYVNQRLDIEGQNELFPTCQTHYEVQLEYSLYARNIKTLDLFKQFFLT